MSDLPLTLNRTANKVFVNNFSYLIFGEIFIGIFSKLLVKYAVFTNLTPIRV